MKKIFTMVALGAALCSGKAQTMPVNLCDFDSTRKVTFAEYNGMLDTTINNPMMTGANMSPKCARYIRAAVQYDNMKVYPKLGKFVDITPFSQQSATSKITMMMMSKMPVGTRVEIQLGARQIPTYPAGVHSIYSATTTVTNQWELLTFNKLMDLTTQGGYGNPQDIDKMVILFNPTGTTSDTVYFDKLMGPDTEFKDGIDELRKNTFSLSQNEPNPAKDHTSFTLNLTQGSAVSVKVYDMLGTEVQQVMDHQLAPGEHQVDINTAALSSGVYFYSVKAGQMLQTRRMIISK